MIEFEKYVDDLKFVCMCYFDGSFVEYWVFIMIWFGFGVNKVCECYIESF